MDILIVIRVIEHTIRNAIRVYELSKLRLIKYFFSNFLPIFSRFFMKNKYKKIFIVKIRSNKIEEECTKSKVDFTFVDFVQIDNKLFV